MSKTARRKWSKANEEIDFDYQDEDPIEKNEADKRYQEYLMNLHLHNKVSKLLKEENEKDKEIKKLEGGFSTYVNGAHKQPERYTPRHVITSSKSKPHAMNLVPKLHIRALEKKEEENRSKSAQTNRRKQWNNSSITFKTMDGMNIRLSAPKSTNSSIKCLSERASSSATCSKNEDYYSDDFESDSSIEETIKRVKDSKLIESVKFSDSVSSLSSLDEKRNENVHKPKRRQCFELSIDDVKFLKQSFSNCNISLDSDSLDEEIEELIEKKSFKKSQNTTNSAIPKICKEPQTNKFLKSNKNPSKTCNFLLESINTLNPNNKKQFWKFISRIEVEDDDDSF